MTKSFETILAEFSAYGAECWLYTSFYGKDWMCDLKITQDDAKLEFKGKGLDPRSAFEAAYAKYSVVIERIPTYNPNLLLESTATEEESF